jgi:hypothetical protein
MRWTMTILHVSYDLTSDEIDTENLDKAQSDKRKG